MLSTKDLCQKLGVSRAWVQTYLRDLGIQGAQRPDDRANVRTVYYDESRVLQYLNAHAICSRQTEILELTDYMEEGELRRRLQKIKGLDKAEQEKSYWRLIDQILPQGVTVITMPVLSARFRGQYAWQPVKCQIKSLDDLATMAQMRGEGRTTPELIYRDNFEFARIKVTVHGRTWFMPSDVLGSDLSVLIRAREP